MLPNSFGMSLSNATLEMIWIEESRPDEIAERWMTISAGCFMIIFSFVGIWINLIVLRHFLTSPASSSSFYMLCSSKSISNSIVLVCYLFYNGPVTLFKFYYGPDFINMIVNQIVAYGVYSQGPMTQLCISINRFLVILMPVFSNREESKLLTISALVLTWSISIFITLIGFPASCVSIFNYDILTWDNLNPCIDILADAVMYLIGFLAVSSNVFNFAVAVKLIILAAKTRKVVDSVATQNRKRTTRKLFLQNCFQDWVYLIDTINSMYIYNLSSSIFYQFMFTIFSNLFIHVADGIIMLGFNYEKRVKQASQN